MMSKGVDPKTERFFTLMKKRSVFAFTLMI